MVGWDYAFKKKLLSLCDFLQQHTVAQILAGNGLSTFSLEFCQVSMTAIERHRMTEQVMKTVDHIKNSRQKEHLDERAGSHSISSLWVCASLPFHLPTTTHTAFGQMYASLYSDWRLEERLNQLPAQLLELSLGLLWLTDADSDGFWAPLNPSLCPDWTSCGTPFQRMGLSSPRTPFSDLCFHKMEILKLVAIVLLPAPNLLTSGPPHHVPFSASHVTSSL